jgi:hypothetical protein
LTRNLHSSYTQKLTSIPYLQTQIIQKHTHNTRLNIYLVANEKAVRLLNQDYITHTLHEIISNLLGQNAQPITKNINLHDPTYIDISHAYKDSYPSIPSRTYTNVPPQIRPYHGAWNPTDFIYTNGSLVTCNPIIGASIVNSKTHTTTHIEIKSQPGRHTINLAELAAITLALEANKHEPTLSILTDNVTATYQYRTYRTPYIIQFT